MKIIKMKMKEIETVNISKKYMDYLEEKYKILFENIETNFANRRIFLSEKDKYLGKRNIM